MFIEINGIIFDADIYQNAVSDLKLRVSDDFFDILKKYGFKRLDSTLFLLPDLDILVSIEFSINGSVRKV